MEEVSIGLPGNPTTHHKSERPPGRSLFLWSGPMEEYPALPETIPSRVPEVPFPS